MIVIKNITLHGTDQTIVDSFSMSVEHSEKVVIIGPSGCGKSSVLKAILAGIERWEGTIRVGGVVLTPKNIAKVRNQIAFIPQEPRLPEGTVEHYFDTMASWSANRGTFFSRKDQLELFDKLSLGFGTMEKETSVLSGGERQRVAIAAAICLQRPILLADEITSALDEVNRETVMEHIFSLPVTLLSVSHDPVWIERSSRTVTMKGKKHG